MEFANPDRTDPPEYLELLLDGSNVYHKKSLGKSTFKFGKINHEWIQAVKLESRYKACINIAKNQGHPEKQCLTYSIGWCLCCIHSKEHCVHGPCARACAHGPCTRCLCTPKCCLPQHLALAFVTPTKPPAPCRFPRCPHECKVLAFEALCHKVKESWG